MALAIDREQNAEKVEEGKNIIAKLSSLKYDIEHDRRLT